MTSLYDFTLPGLNGKPLPLSQFRGKVVLLVNTASKCGFTPQYEGLEKLWQSYRDQGLVVVGVPSNDFGQQEPGDSAAISDFCQVNYGVSFPMTAKTVVKGAAAHPLYLWAGKQAGLLGRPKWNFHKYLFNQQGQLVDWFASQTKPMGPKITTAIGKLLDVKS